MSVVLKTLEKYIDAAPAERRFGAALQIWERRDRRFARLFVLSAVLHIVFYAVVIRFDEWNLQQQLARPRRRAVVVTMLDVAPSPPPPPPRLRSLPERIERVDLSRLRLDPGNANDEDLIERSPKLGNPNARTSAAAVSSPSLAVFPVEPAKPAAPKDAPPAPAPAAGGAAETPPAQPSRAPVSSSQNQAQPNNASVRDGAAERSTRQEEVRGTRDLGLQAIQGQYLAYVRKKIRDTNERIMPRDWIRDVLNREVSADFEVRLDRTGQIVLARLLRSSGYSVLDEAGRQAIYIARPFEGFPPIAGDILTLTVTVYYSPTW
ncbi:MAG TPA: TonB C-terminal domain-containing protein [Blastocatellia bacterium]|nr:TonB C-terminal domain-containing protein [Blastocatellia bacterium]